MNTRSDEKRRFWGTSFGIVFCVFFLIAGVMLWLEHQAHILGTLPLLLPLLICLGMHFFMHGRHSGHNGHRGKHDAQ